MRKLIPPIKELRKILDPGVPEPVYFRVCRWFAVYLTRPLLFTPIKPNHVTLFMLLVGILASIMFLPGTYIYSLLGAILIQFHVFFDCIDGSIARFKRMISLQGEYVDSVSHPIVYSLLYFFMSIGLYFKTDSVLFLFLGTSIIISYHLYNSAIFTVHKIRLRNKLFYERKKQGKSVKTFSFLDQIKFFVRNIYSPPYILLILLIFSVFNYMDYFMYFYGITFPFIAFINIIYEYKIGFKR